MRSPRRGTVTDDSYGRFSITRNGFEYTVKPHLNTVASRLAITVAYDQVIEHIDCDNPPCCYATPCSATSGRAPRPTTSAAWPTQVATETATAGAASGPDPTGANPPNGPNNHATPSRTAGTKPA